jgi:toxin FitB
MSAYILDTNVVSELRKPEPHPGVLAWVAAQEVESLHLTSVTVGELSLDVELLAQGRQRAELEEWLRRVVHERFAGRVLSYDGEAGRTFGGLVARARRAGRKPGVADAQIAAIADSRGMIVATRDVKDFEPLGTRIVNPWATSGHDVPSGAV